MRVGVSSVERDPAALRQRVLAAPAMIGADLSAEVTTPEPYTVEADGEHRFTVAALDLGIKRNVPRRLAARGVTTHVMPAVVHTGRPAAPSSRTRCSSRPARATRPPPTTRSPWPGR